MRGWLSMAVLAVVVAAVSVPVVVSARTHDDALARYRSAASALPGESNRLNGALADFATAHHELARIAGVVDTLRATPAGTLLPAQHAELDETAVGIASALSSVPGEQSTAPEATATMRSTTDALSAAAATLNQQERREQDSLSTTDQAVEAEHVEASVAAAVLDELVTGTSAEGDQPALPGLGDASSDALALYPRAAQASKDAVTAAVKAAEVAADAGASVDAELLVYADRVQSAHASQDAADKAAAAAAAQAAAAAAAAQQARRSSASGSGGSGPGTTNGSSVNPTHGPPVFRSHVTKVIAEGAYTPGCTGAPAQTLQSGQHGLLVITLDYDTPYDYRTFTTDDGWGLTVIACG